MAIFITLYAAIKIYISVMQIGFIASKKEEKALLMSQEEYVNAANYAISKERLAIGETLLEMLVIIFWISHGFSLFGAYFSLDTLYGGVAFLLLFFFLNYLVGFPFGYYKSMILDKEYGFNKQSGKEYFIDTLKGLLMGGAFLVLISGAIIYFINSFVYWWLYAFLFVFVVIIFINMVYPTLIAPVFNKFTPLEEGALKVAIDELLVKNGFKSSGVFIMDASKRDSRLNAYFGGLGAVKRVVLFDTLIKKLEQNEIIAVLGHELGHFRHGDIYKNILLSGVVMFGLFLLFGNLGEGFYAGLGVEREAPLMLALFSLLLSPIMFFIAPIISYFSRKAEYKADAHGVNSSDRDSLGFALLKLVRENRAFPLSHPLYILFYYSHPPVIKRFEMMGFVAYDDQPSS